MLFSWGRKTLDELDASVGSSASASTSSRVSNRGSRSQRRSGDIEARGDLSTSTESAIPMRARDGARRKSGEDGERTSSIGLRRAGADDGLDDRGGSAQVTSTGVAEGNEPDARARADDGLDDRRGSARITSTGIEVAAAESRAGSMAAVSLSYSGRSARATAANREQDSDNLATRAASADSGDERSGDDGTMSLLTLSSSPTASDGSGDELNSHDGTISLLAQPPSQRSCWASGRIESRHDDQLSNARRREIRRLYRCGHRSPPSSLIQQEGRSPVRCTCFAPTDIFKLSN